MAKITTALLQWMQCGW